MRRGIIVVSFGTSHTDTREKTLDVILRDFQEHFPGLPVCQAWTSRKILQKIRERDGKVIFHVEEAMRWMLEQGVDDVLLQPTHLIDGIENHSMKQAAETFAEHFQRIRIGAPILANASDREEALAGAMQEIGQEEGEAIVWMGHGTAHKSNQVYGELEEILRRQHPTAFMGTVEAYPCLNELIDRVKAAGYHRVAMAPFMMVAGDHAKNDMAGDGVDSWKNQFEAAGLTVRCILRGLGEYSCIRAIIRRHAEEGLRAEN